MSLQWRNQIWQSLEVGAGKRCSQCVSECVSECGRAGGGGAAGEGSCPWPG